MHQTQYREKEGKILEVCKQVDGFIAGELTESIIYGTSYDIITARDKVMPCSRSQFYRKKQQAKDLIKQTLEGT